MTTTSSSKIITRCSWAETNVLLQEYHDKEWGRPVRDNRALFALLNLEGAQAGLSWLTVLQRREGYYRAFAQFDPQVLVQYTDADCEALMSDPNIIRNRLKIYAVIKNARAYQALTKGQDFSDYIWQFSNHKILKHRDQEKALLISQSMSKALRMQGFTFVGPTICFAYMQAIGMIYDHEPRCFLA